MFLGDACLLSRLGVVVAERAVVGAEDGKGPVFEPRPDGFLVCFVSGRRRADTFRAFEARLVKVVSGEEQVLWASRVQS